jgi:hypothetical protein
LETCPTVFHRFRASQRDVKAPAENQPRNEGNEERTDVPGHYCTHKQAVVSAGGRLPMRGAGANFDSESLRCKDKACKCS